MRLFLSIILMLWFSLLCNCSNPAQPVRTINYRVVKQEPFTDKHPFVTDYIAVDNSASKEEIYTISIKILNEAWQRKTKNGRNPQSVSIRTYYNDDCSLKNEIGWVVQAGDPVGGRIAYKYLGVTTYDREVALTDAEISRNEEIGKLAGELLKEANKLQDR